MASKTSKGKTSKGKTSKGKTSKATSKGKTAAKRGARAPVLADLDQPPLIKFFLETERTVSHLTLELDGKVARCFWRGPGHQAQAAALIQVVSPMLRTNPAQALATIRASGDDE